MTHCPHCGAIIEQERSEQSHRHEFAWLREAWQNLPEYLADLYPTPDHLRKRALIEAGFYDETMVDAGTNAAALRVARELIRPMDEFAHVVVRGPLIVMRRAKSQSRRTMNKTEFQASKTAIMQVIADMLGTTVDHLSKERAA